MPEPPEFSGQHNSATDIPRDPSLLEILAPNYVPLGSTIKYLHYIRDNVNTYLVTYNVALEVQGVWATC